MIEILEKPPQAVIRLHDADNVVIARSNVEIGTRLGDGLTCRSQCLRAIRSPRADPERRAHPQVQRDDRLRRHDITPGRSCIRTTWSFGNSTATTPTRRTIVPSSCSPRANAQPSWASCAQTGKSPRATTSAAVHRELLGHGSPQGRRVVHAGAACRISECRWVVAFAHATGCAWR